MAEPTFLSRDIDYLGELGAHLRGLTGYRTLAHELIPNADDVKADANGFGGGEDVTPTESGVGTLDQTPAATGGNEPEVPTPGPRPTGTGGQTRPPSKTR